MYGGEHWSEGQGAMMHTQHQSSLYPPLPMRETYVGGYPTASGLSPTQEGMQSVSPSGIPSYTDQPLPGTVPPYAMPYRYEEDEGDDE